MLISDHIAQLIESMLRESGGVLEIRRNDMAERIGCSPSQINYVITSRFSPERGYLIESRRGGGGYVRIVKKHFSDKQAYLMHCFASIGDSVEEAAALAYISALEKSGSITRQCAAVMRAALVGAPLSAIREERRGELRATLLKQMLLSLSD